MKILSIEAWNGRDGWSWNDWHTVGCITKADFEALNSTRKLLKWFRDEGYLSRKKSVGKCGIEDDGYNIVVTNRVTFEPLFAIEYGGEYRG